MLDRALEDAVAEAVRKAGQAESVARRLTAWLTEMSKGALVAEDDARFLRAVCDVLELEDGDAD